MYAWMERFKSQPLARSNDSAASRDTSHSSIRNLMSSSLITLQSRMPSRLERFNNRHMKRDIWPLTLFPWGPLMIQSSIDKQNNHS